MFRLAVRNLLQDRTRLAFSVGGTGLALTLVLLFGAVFAGATNRLTAYIDHAGADVWVAQAGVRTMHMSTSALPASVVDEVISVPGVDQAVPILYAEDMVEANGQEFIAYVLGVPPGATLGGPWRLVAGRLPGPGEAIIDRAIATRAGAHVGDPVMVLGQGMKIAGFNAGGSSLVSSVTFVSMDDFARVRGGGDVISFVLVKVKPGESPATVASRISVRIGGATVQTRAEFASEERALMQDMSADLISIMNTGGYLTGLAVVTLTVYMATIARRREYGVLKALGVRNSRLYRVVVYQAFLSVALGLFAGLGITLLLAAVIPRFNELIALSLSASAVLRVTLASVALAGVAALLSARQVAGLEPMSAMRKG